MGANIFAEGYERKLGMEHFFIIYFYIIMVQQKCQ